MPSKYIYTKINGQEIKLSNPDKILYPSAHLVKAEVIKYLLEVSDHLLPQITQRPLTLIRFPDGIDGKKFYSKNKPSWTPEWIHSTLFPGDEENHYIMADTKASLAWIGNLAGLEIHPMNVRSPNLLYPDQFIFDLDPSTEIDFSSLKNLAQNLKSFLENKGFVPFIKTSGGKGLHIYVPIKPVNTIDEVYAYVKKLAQEYVADHDKTTTLKISKAKRKGKVLLDIYRNSKAQSCVAPFSLRAKPHAPVSTPFDWENLESLTHSQHWNISNIFAHLKDKGNPWKNFNKFAVPINHNKRKPKTRLAEYTKKRNFSKTPEPTSKDAIQTSGHDYVVQIHNATNLHYDLRLEENGTLLSWAIPKGFPNKKGIKRLAIRTEDHPLKYLNFEGVIPKNEYGGGEMWVFDKGQYTIIKKTSKKFHFTLSKGQLAGEYILFQTKGEQWILEKKDNNESDLDELNKPMLAVLGKKMPNKKDYFFEIKWDGIRAIFVIDNDDFRIFSRNGNDITTQFPKLNIMKDAIEAETAVMDGEIVHLDHEGKPLFHKIVSRMHTKGNHSIKQASNNTPAVAYLFDLLYLDGKDCRKETNIRRRAWLRTILKSNDTIRFSEVFEDGKSLFDAITEQGMEGIMCKLKSGKYYSGERNRTWKKLKVSYEDVAYIIGYTAGEGDRAGHIGALHLAKKIDEKMKYMGKVGTGFTIEKLKSIHEKLNKVDKTTKPFRQKMDATDKSTWINPEYLCKIKYASMSSNHTYREPVFIKLWKE